MKYLFSILCFGIVFAFAYQAFEGQSDQIQPEFRDRLAEKYEPSDEFFMQRANPDGSFDIRAYENGLTEARLAAHSRSTTDGFDEEWTVQGPGNIGARVNTLAVDPTNEDIIYAGFAGGGVFKTTDGGDNWVPIFDDQNFLAIGDIVIDPVNPQRVYVGTGDPNISGYPKIGDGLYRSEDGGATWTHLGLAAQRIISEIIVDPTNTDIIYTATMGLPFEPTNERGLYKSSDGGTSWDQILFLSDTTGVIDILMDPFDSQVLYAAGWDRIRNNKVSLVAGYGALIYKSTDGGNNWIVLAGGLPNEIPHSRIGLEISQQNQGVLFAQYCDATGYNIEAIYKSTDAGNSWQPIDLGDPYYDGLDQGALGGFGWYFGKIRVNPLNDNDLFLLGVDLWRTSTGGTNWATATPPWWQYTVHADKHDLIFTPSGNMILATDGGIYRSDITGENWEDIENIPTTQLYRVAYNPHRPDWYYGGAQDNGSMGGNADNINDWVRIYGGDGFQMAFDTENADRFFAETQNGNIAVTNDGGYSFESGDDGIDNSDRKNWDMPYFISPHFNQILYAGTQFVYSGTGATPIWNKISEDLTDGTDEQHRYHNISTLNESPLEAGLLYAGTGDGNVWRGDNFGASWTSISNGLIDQYVTDVVPSPDITDNVYVSFSGYRDNDRLPRIHRSNDRGDSWEDISNGLPDLAINDLIVVPGYNDSLLFVATDGGIYGTRDAATTWDRLGSNMPMIQVYDMVFNPAMNQLVAGTFARSIMTYPLDSLIQEEPMDSTTALKPELPVLQHALKIFPNPATDHITIDLANIEPGRAMEMAILSADGKLVMQEKWQERNISEQIDISNWPAGQYFIKIKMRHEVRRGSFLKMK